MATSKGQTLAISGKGVFGKVANYSALPNPTLHDGETWIALASQGTSWLPGSLGGTFYDKGQYYSDGTNWIYDSTPYQASLSTVNTGTNDDQFVSSYTLSNSTWAFTAAKVLSTLLSGLSVATGGVITSSDTILQALGKLQYQITNLGGTYLNLSGSNANQDLDIGNYIFNAKSFHAKGTAGAGHLGLKHQSADITASASESSIGANSDGDATWKNDGNTIQKINVFKRTTFGNANYTALKSDDLVCTSVTFTTSRTVTLPSDSLQAHEITVADEFQTVTATNTLIIGVSTGKYLNGVLNGTETIQNAGGWRRFKTDGAGNWSFDAGIVRQSKTQTLTNKTIQKRILTVTQSATPATNIDNGDIVSITGLAQAITSMTSGLSGTPYDGQMIMWQITDNGTARAITWGASFASTTNFTLPTTTVISTMLRVLTQWNAVTSKHECIG